MKILVACEESQIVTKAFRAKGHEAYSCDIIDCSGGHPEWHIKDDVLKHLNDGWDMILAFPPCTYLCSSGMHWTTRGLRDPKLTEDALMLVKEIMKADCKKKVLENPIGCISTRIRKPEQKVQPWQFGEDASKKTCFWIEGLPLLEHTKIIPPKEYSRVVYAWDCKPCPDCGEPYCFIHNDHYSDCDCIGPSQDEATYKRIDGYEFATLSEKEIKPVWANQTPSGQNKLGPSPERDKLRSKAYQGIANAMAEQWG